MSRRSFFRRVLVALDCSPSSLAALDVAAEIAAAVDAELLGVFVEDVELLHGAAHPLARQISSFSGIVRPLDPEQMLLELRTLAARARAALVAAGRRSGVRFSFQVRRGTVAAALLEELSATDVVSIGRVGWSALGKDRLGTTARRLLENGPAAALLARRGGVAGKSVWTVFDGSPEARHALTVAGGLCGIRPLDVLIVGPDEAARVRLAGEAAAAVDRGSVRSHDSATARVSEALPALRRETIGLLVLPANVAREAGHDLPALIAGLDCPVLIVREAARGAEPER